MLPTRRTAMVGGMGQEDRGVGNQLDLGKVCGLLATRAAVAKCKTAALEPNQLTANLVASIAVAGAPPPAGPSPLIFGILQVPV